MEGHSTSKTSSNDMNNELSEREIEKMMPLIASKRIIHLGISLTKEFKDMYIENCKTLTKENEEDTNK